MSTFNGGREHVRIACVQIKWCYTCIIKISPLAGWLDLAPCDTLRVGGWRGRSRGGPGNRAAVWRGIGLFFLLVWVLSKSRRSHEG